MLSNRFGFLFRYIILDHRSINETFECYFLNCADQFRGGNLQAFVVSMVMEFPRSSILNITEPIDEEERNNVADKVTTLF